MVMKGKASSALTISAVGFIAAFLVDLYMIMAYPSYISVIIIVSMIVVVDTYFMVDAILAKIDEVESVKLDKANELTKVEKGIYSVAKREETARTQSMTALLDLMIELKDENSRLYTELVSQNRLLEESGIKTENGIKSDNENADRIVSSSQEIAKLIGEMAAANAKHETEAIEILNDICKALEERNEPDYDNEFTKLKAM